MADKTKSRGAATKPVDASAIPQDSELEKPSEEDVPSNTGVHQAGYRLPEEFRVMEEAEGDPEKYAALQRERNEEAEEKRLAAEKKATKDAGGPAANKAKK